MVLENVVQKAKESSQDVNPKKYSMFIASKPVDGGRKWLDVTNKYTKDVGTCIIVFRDLNQRLPLSQIFQ